MNDMTIYSRPGISIITEQYLIDLVKESFGLKLYLWVTIKSRVDTYRIPRQVLMTCLMDFMDYTNAQAGAVCHRDHSTAFSARKVTHETLLHDKVYGPIVKVIFDHLKSIVSLERKKHTGGFRVEPGVYVRDRHIDWNPRNDANGEAVTTYVTKR